HAHAGVLHHLDDGAEVAYLGAGQPAGRLVQQNEARPHHEAPGDLEEALLRVLQQVGPPVEDASQSHAMQQRESAQSELSVLTMGVSVRPILMAAASRTRSGPTGLDSRRRPPMRPTSVSISRPIPSGTRRTTTSKSRP